jgi:O-succinylbenzoic acid--CoA ligase
MERAELSDLVRATGCAEERDGFTFLCDPKGSVREQVALKRSAIHNPRSEIESGWLCIPTGGTSGGVRFARHDERTLTAAVAGFRAHFGFERVNAVGVLPPHHVSGLMARVRCAASGGEHVAWDWKQLELGQWPSVRGDAWVLSLVPTQLQRLLVSKDAVAWLRKFRVIFIGGGPIWPELADQAAAARLPLSLSYGMTETAAMVAALRPEEFLAGERSSGRAMPHARISITAEGVVEIAGESLFRGYYPETRMEGVFTTEDLGRIDERGFVQILGRRDAAIITGGKKIHPADVEAVLRASGRFADLAVVGVPDPEWGQAVVACYLADGSIWDRAAEQAMGDRLVGPNRPKRYVAIAAKDWPRTAQGKLNRNALLAVIAARDVSPS